ncbi:unnamed protein product [Thlaspi arvense]|uniref:Bifunctional inhibitor/plant lipid transfer protein/seed storage helical domain-containing protein n=1 Tax=Thlaspi arvense TaxID=13288 RepID=A0AAU9SRD5_THLAR|nr:unnamed protein product [Thlaspi arvense]
MINSASLALFFALNILFFTLTAATDYCRCNPSPKPTHGIAPSFPRPSPRPLVPSPYPRPRVPSPSLGQPSAQPCCSVIQGLVDLDAAVCLCTALRANVLGINLHVPISLSVLLNVCNKNLPSGFQCA